MASVSAFSIFARVTSLFVLLQLCALSTENKEADDSQQGPENEGETCSPQPLRCQRRQTQGRRENIHHLREGDAFLAVPPDPSRRVCSLSDQRRSPTLTRQQETKQMTGGFLLLCKKKCIWESRHVMM